MRRSIPGVACSRLPLMRLIVPALLLCLWLVAGRPAQAIINGEPAEASRYGSYVSIRGISRYPSQKGAEVNACGGTLVAPNWVLTAAHCKAAFVTSAQRQGPVEVGVGLRDDGRFAGRLKVVSYHFSPARLGGGRVDAALLKLDGDATMSGARVATLHEGEVAEGLATVTVGLGVATLGGTLQKYASVVASQSHCDNPWADFDPDHDFCVGIPGSKQRTGYGDSGGPIYVLDASAVHPVLLGVVKGGVKTGSNTSKESEYIRYTRASALKDWIARLVSADRAALPDSPAKVRHLVH